MIKADNKLIIARTDGVVMLADINREKFSPRSQFTAFGSTLRALPALSNGGLFIRDETTLKRYAVGK